MGKKLKKVRLVVQLEIGAEDAGEAYRVVNKVLDSFVLQDAIHEYEGDDCGAREVTSCICSFAEDVSRELKDAAEDLIRAGEFDSASEYRKAVKKVRAAIAKSEGV